MDFDLQWLLLGLPVAFALGWLGSRFDLRQWKREQKDSPKAYYKGLNLLLNEQHDKAIDSFIEAVQQDPDTSDLHFALGNLFRRRGEYERAVRVHEHLLKRADLPASERERAQHALAQDFMKAGLFDRAEEAFKALDGTVFDTEARLALLALHERSRDWRAAVEVAARLERSGSGSFATRIANYWCELALEADARQQTTEADAALQRGVGLGGLLACIGLQRKLAPVVRDARGKGAAAAALEPGRHLDGGAPVARALVQRQQRQARLGVEHRTVERLEGLLGAVEQAGLHEVLRQRMLGAFALRGRQVGALEQVLVHAHGALVFAAAAEQVAQREVQVGGVRILLHRLDEGVDRLVVLLVEQQVQALVVGLGRILLLALPLPQVEAGAQPAEREGHRQAEQQPLQVKVHRGAGVPG